MDIDWANVFNWMSLLKCFVVGGLICVVGQILIDNTSFHFCPDRFQHCLFLPYQLPPFLKKGKRKSPFPD